MRFRLRTLLIVLAVGPPALAGLWLAGAWAVGEWRQLQRLEAWEQQGYPEDPFANRREAGLIP